MRIKPTLLGGVAVGVLLAASAAAPVQAKTVKKPSANAEMQHQLDELREQVQFLKDRLDELP